MSWLDPTDVPKHMGSSLSYSDVADILAQVRDNNLAGKIIGKRPSLSRVVPTFDVARGCVYIIEFILSQGGQSLVIEARGMPKGVMMKDAVQVYLNEGIEAYRALTGAAKLPTRTPKITKQARPVDAGASPFAVSTSTLQSHKSK